MNRYIGAFLIVIMVLVAGTIGYDCGVRKGFTPGSIEMLKSYRLDLPQDISNISSNKIENIKISKDSLAHKIYLFFDHSLDKITSGDTPRIIGTFQNIFICEEGISVKLSNGAYDYLTPQEFDSLFGFKIYCPKVFHTEIFKNDLKVKK